MCALEPKQGCNQRSNILGFHLLTDQYQNCYFDTSIAAKLNLRLWRGSLTLRDGERDGGGGRGGEERRYRRRMQQGMRQMVVEGSR